MQDMIYRQEAIDTCMREDVRTGYDGACLIAQLPSAQPETHDKRTETHACDLISRQAAIDAVSYSIELCNKALDSITLVGRDRYAVEVERNSLLKLKDDIKLLPTAQPEIIRCGECKHWREDHTCGEHSLVSPMMAYEFCSRAERRQDEHIN